MSQRQNPHIQRQRPIGRSAITITPEIRFKEPVLTKSIVFPPDVQRAIKIGRSIGKKTEQAIQLRLFQEPNTTIDIVTLSDSEVDAIFSEFQTPRPEEEEEEEYKNNSGNDDFDSFIDTYFNMSITI
tara:strand:- start:97 stop:477 length:381 start_codon:yes stop_codon:yes gene_type:complete